MISFFFFLYTKPNQSQPYILINCQRPTGFDFDRRSPTNTTGIHVIVMAHLASLATQAKAIHMAHCSLRCDLLSKEPRGKTKNRKEKKLVKTNYCS